LHRYSEADESALAAVEGGEAPAPIAAAAAAEVAEQKVKAEAGLYTLNLKLQTPFYQ
jgi:hypothetical protein